MRTDDDLVRTVASIVSRQRPDVPAHGLPLSLLNELRQLIDCDVLSFEGFDAARQEVWFSQVIPDVAAVADPGLIGAHWAHYWNCEPCSYPDRTGDLRSVLTIPDFYSARQWHSTGMYADLYRPRGLEHELMLCLPPTSGPGVGPGRTLRLFLFRGRGAGFTETERALLSLLRPHLHQAYLDAERQRQPPVPLTARQLELVDLLAAGYTNAQIARRLGVAESTVRKHLEHVFHRLGVTSRTAAVVRALGTSHQSSIGSSTWCRS